MGLLIEEDLPTLFGGKTDLHLASPDFDVKTAPATIQTLVKTVNLGQVARNGALLEKKAKQPNHINWFVKLYTAMAETGLHFKEELWRDSRGHYRSYESPIYVLTDKDVVMSSKNVYMGPIPNEVLELRNKFPAVDNLLSSYQLLNPALESPELLEFFKEHTHVQLIDYDKICRDVFLPRVRVTEQPPQKDELIGYTRLLQQGPPIYETIWVLTKKGDIKPSNQVFLGAAYFPSENWERYSQYCPEIDFLSKAYLEGIAHEEVAAWKTFFGTVGVKEQADNPYVAQFAMAFVEDKLAPDLTNFVQKDRQKNGYDREAQRAADKTIVYLEIKGQKKEGPVELRGNEPIAAKQAKQKKQLFWLCVVPGVPENPQLWVVDDPLDIGDYDTVSIDTSKWKSHGRRIV